MTELTATQGTDPEKAATVDLQWNVPQNRLFTNEGVGPG